MFLFNDKMSKRRMTEDDKEYIAPSAKSITAAQLEVSRDAQSVGS